MSAVKLTIYLDASDIKKIDDVAVELGLSRTDVIRAALRQFFSFRSGKGWDPHRLAEVVEFSQLVLDQYLKDNHPDLRDPILDATVRRMEKYHGR
mgnify:FL=1